MFANIFGKPGEGIHSVRIFDFAMVDVVMTFIGAYFISLLFNFLMDIKLSYWVYLIGLFLFGIISHELFCVDTTVSKILGGRYFTK